MGKEWKKSTINNECTMSAKLPQGMKSNILLIFFPSPRSSFFGAPPLEILFKNMWILGIMEANVSLN